MVVTFGEIMMRLATPGFLRFSQAHLLEITYGGGEANVAVSLTNYGLKTQFVTRLPKNDMAQRAIHELRGIGVGVDHIVRGGDRIGIYFIEGGASQRASKVTYDRAHSAIAEIKPGEVDWDAAFAGAKWFHWTGITPALSDSAAAVTREACLAARKHGLTVSTDLNYRKKLWSREKAGQVMGGLMEFVDVCIANEEDAESVFNIKGAEVTSGQIEHGQYEDVARQLIERFNFKQVAITLRESFSASHNGWSAMLHTGGKSHFSRRYDINIVDRVGGGDSFGAGLIYALLRGDDPDKAINFAVAASCLKHSIPGDYNRVTLEEVETLAKGDASGRVQR
ncbi:MAG TPA: sugar kinase [Chthoniobacteraceae bacterium]|nr:sugar kinase [Chthoniobacteraceae bacterium]